MKTTILVNINIISKHEHHYQTTTPLVNCNLSNC